MSKERPPCQIDLKAIISEKAIIVGIHLVTIKANAVLHPYAKIDSTHGPIIIGDSCIVSERAVIQAPSGSPPSGVQIGDHVTIETSAVVQSSVVGQVTTVGAFATLEPASHIGNFCKISPAVCVTEGTAVPDYTVVLDADRSRIDRTTASREDIRQLRIKGQSMTVEVLRRLIPTNIAKWQ